MRTVLVRVLTVLLVTSLLSSGAARAQQADVPTTASLPKGPGLAGTYPGDLGIDSDEAVVFVEDFEQETLDRVLAHWTANKNENGNALAFAPDGPPGATGKQALQVTATRGQNEGGYLFKTLEQGSDELYIRFYTKFAPDYGFCHHFVRIRGMIDPVPYPMGPVSKEPSTRWCGTDVEPLDAPLLSRSGGPLAAPGAWVLSSYWPEMKSWQGPGGTSFYPDVFQPSRSVAVPRDRWVCVEVMVKMNTSPETSDGEQALWIDGELVSHLGPGTVRGYWRRDKYVLDAQKGTPFEGFRWRRDMRLKWNRLWLLHYVSERAFKQTDTYAAEHPQADVNTRSATVWFDNIVIARRYVGPIAREGADSTQR